MQLDGLGVERTWRVVLALLTADTAWMLSTSVPGSVGMASLARFSYPAYIVTVKDGKCPPPASLAYGETKSSKTGAQMLIQSTLCR